MFSSPLSLFGSFFYGITLPLKSTALILRKPKLLMWSSVPVFLSFTFYSLGFGALLKQLKAIFASYLASWGLASSGWAWAIFTVIVTPVLFLIGGMTFSFVMTLLSSPFNDFLSEAAEPYCSPPLPSTDPSTLRQKLRLLWIDAGKSITATLAWLLALMLSWIPILNILSLLIAFQMIAFQFLSYPQTRRNISIGDGLRFLMSRFFSCLGFGIVFSLLFSIPIISGFMIPVAVVSGTLLFSRAESPTDRRLR